MPTSEPVRLQSERLHFREFRGTDAEAVLEIFGDPEVVTFTEWEPFTSKADALWIINWAVDAAQQEPRTVFAFTLALLTPEPEATVKEGEDAVTVIGIGTLV